MYNIFKSKSPFAVPIIELIQWAIIGIFILFKLGHLALPTFYDEAWVYYPATNCLAENGWSAIFDETCTKFTRGHPLLFHSIVLVWIKCFGASMASVHSLALIISIILLIVLKYNLRHYLSPAAVTLVLALFSIQSIFIVQSSMLLPEVLLCLFIFLALHSYIQSDFSRFTLYFILAIFTKEIAVIYLPAFALPDLLSFTKSKWTRPKLISYTVICMTWISYLLLEKFIHGWFFYPDHAGTIKSNFGEVSANWKYISEYVLAKQGRWYFILISILGLIMTQKKSILLWVTGIAIFFLFFKYIPMQGLYFIVMLVLLWLSITYWQIHTIERGFIQSFFTSIIFVSTLVFSFSFFTMRYLLPGILCLFIAFAHILNAYCSKNSIYGICAFTFGICLLKNFSNRHMGDTDMGALTAMRGQQKMYNALDTILLNKSIICTNSFLLWCELGGTYNYWKPPKKVDHHIEYDRHCEVFVYTNIESNAQNPYDSIPGPMIWLYKEGPFYGEIKVRP